MRTVIQRVSCASVVSGGYKTKISLGIVALVGVGKDDKKWDVDYIADKILNLRIFSDENGKLNYSLKDKNWELLVVPQFTLYGNCDKGRRPSFEQSAGFSKGKEKFKLLKNRLRSGYLEDKIKWGLFGKDMSVKMVNKGPVTLIIDS